MLPGAKGRVDQEGGRREGQAICLEKVVAIF